MRMKFYLVQVRDSAISPDVAALDRLYFFETYAWACDEFDRLRRQYEEEGLQLISLAAPDPELGGCFLYVSKYGRTVSARLNDVHVGD